MEHCILSISYYLFHITTIQLLPFFYSIESATFVLRKVSEYMNTVFVFKMHAHTELKKNANSTGFPIGTVCRFHLGRVCEILLWSIFFSMYRGFMSCIWRLLFRLINHSQMIQIESIWNVWPRGIDVFFCRNKLNENYSFMAHVKIRYDISSDRTFYVGNNVALLQWPGICEIVYWKRCPQRKYIRNRFRLCAKRISCGNNNWANDINDRWPIQFNTHRAEHNITTLRGNRSSPAIEFHHMFV